MSWVEGWKCDKCGAFSPGCRDDFGPDGWTLVAKLMNGTFTSEHEVHLCDKCPPKLPK